MLGLIVSYAKCLELSKRLPELNRAWQEVLFRELEKLKKRKDDKKSSYFL